MDDMVTSKGLGIRLIGVADKRANTTPGAQNITTSNLNVRVQVVLDLVHDENNIVLMRRGPIGDLARRVCGPGHGVLLPRQEKDHTTVTSVRIEETHILGRVIVGQHDVDPRAWLADFASDRVVHFADLIRVRPGRVHHTFGSL